MAPRREVAARPSSEGKSGESATTSALSKMTPRTLYVICNWDRDFENAKSRTIERTTFFCAPNHFDGKKIRQLSALENSEQLFGAFHLVCAVASKCWYRGVLLDNDGPITARDLANKTGFRESVFADALPKLSSPEIRLLERYEIVQSPDGSWVLPRNVLAWAIPRDQRRQTPQAPRVPRKSARIRPVPRESGNVHLREEKGREQKKREEEKRKPSAVSLKRETNPADPSKFITNFDEAKRLICERILNGKDPSRPWSYEADHNLVRQLPIPRIELERIAWFRGLPNDGSPELEARRDITEKGLTAFWSDEFTRANSFWQRIYGWREKIKKEPSQ
jgi:hypothetical protein